MIYIFKIIHQLYTTTTKNPPPKIFQTVEGKCKTTNLVYKNTVEAAGTTKQYIGLTSNTFKERFTGHKASFTYRKYAHKTTLSSHIWELKDQQTTYKQHWSIFSLAPSYSRRVRI